MFKHDHDYDYHRPYWMGGRFVMPIIGGVFIACIMGLLFGWLVMLLWNWLMPELFKLGMISYWQAFGLIVLSKLIFSSFGGHHKWHKSRHHHGMDGSDWGRDSDWRVGEGWHDWRYYKDYWREEGKAAFESYIAKKKGSTETEQPEDDSRSTRTRGRR